jgi:hypothetical protein
VEVAPGSRSSRSSTRSPVVLRLLELRCAEAVAVPAIARRSLAYCQIAL